MLAGFVCCVARAGDGSVARLGWGIRVLGGNWWFEGAAVWRGRSLGLWGMGLGGWAVGRGCEKEGQEEVRYEFWKDVMAWV